MIIQSISPLPVVVGRYDNNFVQTADDFLNKLPNFCTELNTYAREANSLIDEAVSLKENYFEPIVQIHDETLAYRNDAVNAKEAIQNYVIPNEATYSIEQIDALIEEMEDSIFLDFKF
jgi:hypothetical protein